jgi:hypothetical protein
MNKQILHRLVHRDKMVRLLVVLGEAKECREQHESNLRIRTTYSNASINEGSNGSIILYWRGKIYNACGVR